MLQRICCYFGKHLPRVVNYSTFGWWYQGGHQEDGDSVLVWAEVWEQRTRSSVCPCCLVGTHTNADHVAKEFTLRIPRAEWERTNNSYAYFTNSPTNRLMISELGSQFDRVPASLREESK